MSLWHPYDTMPPARPPIEVRSAQGVRLQLAGGLELIDGMSSWWAAIWGYRHPVLDQAVRDQLDRMAHVMFGGITHPPAQQLAQRLTDLAPPGLDQVFLADSGSVSVEVAMKACLQYQLAAGHPAKTRFLALSGGYHGDTLGAMSVCDPIGGMHHMFAGVLPRHLFAPRPPAQPSDEWASQVRRLADEHSGQLAAVIAEPVLQGAGGMWAYHPSHLRVLREVADAHGALLVFDEIATGFGRTGTLFANSGVVPDIMCVGKALTGGYMSMAAMLCNATVAASISSAGPLMHGPTFMANPLGCALALASTGLLLSEDWESHVQRVNAGLRHSLAPALELDCVQDVRTIGAVGVVQLDHPVDVAAATEAAVAHGVWLRPFRDLVYTMPPYITTDDEVQTIGRAVVAAARAG
ncbi:MAG TPA: adenosylmethionine--8-amino-7-oxononanoate transaminase [Acidimicrobiales bacterium]|nr:adenosylmethionine--8-amino-7-oxononanoate transaminase [Acidimicrobiales bacterium]